VDIGFLPGDVDQSGTVSPVDLVRFRGMLLGTFHNPRGVDVDYSDTDRNGSETAIDLVRYRQLLLGTSPATRVWLGEALPAQP